MRLWDDNPWNWGIISLGEKMDTKYEGIIPENFDKMEWRAINAKLSTFGEKEEVKFYASVAWQIDHTWTWVIHNTRFRGNDVSKERAQKAALQIFLDAKNIPVKEKEKEKGKHAVKNKKKDRKDDGHSNAQ